MKLIHSFILLVLLGVACKPGNNVDPGEVAVTLDGYDQRMCACCGGQYMRLDNDTLRYRFFALPTPADPSIDYGFDRHFWIRFKPYEGACRSPELITITSIRRR